MLRKPIFGTITFIILLMLAGLFAVADDINDSINQSIDQSVNQTELTDNQTVLIDNSTIIDQNIPIPEPVLTTDFDLVNLSPHEIIVGDIIFNIELKNTGTTVLKNLIPVVVGKGFSMYDVVPIQTLNPGQSAFMYVSGHLSDAGSMFLTVKVNDKIFYQRITVQNPSIQIDAAALEQAQEAKTQAYQALSLQLGELESDYRVLEQEFAKKKNKYDLSDVKLEDVKEYLRAAQSNLASGDLQKANVSLILSLSEYKDQLNHMNNASKKPLINKIKDNIVIISTIAGALLTLFALYEILKKKKESIAQKVSNIKVDKFVQFVVKKNGDKKIPDMAAKDKEPKKESEPAKKAVKNKKNTQKNK